MAMTKPAGVGLQIIAVIVLIIAAVQAIDPNTSGVPWMALIAGVGLLYIGGRPSQRNS